MFNRFLKAGCALGKNTATQSAALASIARDTVSGFITTAHHTLMILGIGALAVLAMMFFKPEITDHLKALSPFTSANEQEQLASVEELPSAMDTPSTAFAPASPQAQQPVMTKAITPAPLATIEIKKASLSPEQQSVAKWLSKRYRVAGDATRMLVAETYNIAGELKLDPLLILAVAAIESGFNPFAESSMGAQGLMQVMSKIHQDKFRELGGVKAALNPVANIKVGALILKDYVRRAGSVEGGLKWYVGAAAMQTDSGYGSRVLNEYRRLQQVAAGKNVSTYSTVAIKSSPKSTVTTANAESKAAGTDEGKSVKLDTQPSNTEDEKLKVVSL